MATREEIREWLSEKVKHHYGSVQHVGILLEDLIADDILDATSTRKQLGKPVKADIAKGFPYLIGLEKSRKMAEQERNKAIRALKIFGKRADTLREIADHVIKRRK